MTQHYIAFPPSETLAKAKEEFISTVRRKNSKEPVLLAAYVNPFVHEFLDTFALDILEVAGMKGGSKKVAEAAVSTIKKTCAPVIKQTVKKLDARQNGIIADHIDAHHIRLTRKNLPEAEFIAIPISPDFYQKIAATHEELRQGITDINRANFIANIKGIVDLAAEELIYEMMARVGLGPILRKLVDVTTETAVKLLHSTHEKVFLKASDEELLKSVEHFEEMLIQKES